MTRPHEAIRFHICIFSDVHCWIPMAFVDCLLTDSHDLVAFPVLLLIDVENPFQLSKCTVPISTPLKLVSIVFENCSSCSLQYWMSGLMISTSPIWCFDQAFLNSYWVKHAINTDKHSCVAFVLIKLVSTIFSLLCISSLFQSHVFFCRFADFRLVEIMLERYRTVHVHHPGFNEDVNKFTVKHRWDLETLLVFQEYYIGSNIDYRSKYSMIYSEANVQSKPESDSISHQWCSH